MPAPPLGSEPATMRSRASRVAGMPKARFSPIESETRFRFFVERDLFVSPVPTFPDRALGVRRARERRRQVAHDRLHQLFVVALRHDADDGLRSRLAHDKPSMRAKPRFHFGNRAFHLAFRQHIRAVDGADTLHFLWNGL